jgi:two-component system, chemotaxis family, sensor kinase CheA
MKDRRFFVSLPDSHPEASSGSDSGVFQRLGKLIDRVRRLDQRLIEQMQYSVQHIAQVAPSHVRRTPFRPMVKGFLPWMNQIASLQGKQLDVRIDVDDRIDVLAAHVGMYQQILYHLLQNAIHHGVESPDKRLSRGKAKKGQVHVSFEDLDDAYCLTVRDDGNGLGRSVEQSANIPLPVSVSEASVSEEIDGPVERQSTFPEGSLGLGLHLVRRHVESLQGELDIETRAGRETIIRLIFPKR